MSRTAGALAELAAALIAGGAGVYLLTRHSVPLTVGGQAGESWLEVLAHGIGAYFLARGLWMLARIGQQHDTVRAVERLVELAESEAEESRDA